MTTALSSNLTQEKIEVGIVKLQRRIQEIDQIISDNTSYDNAKIEAATFKIKENVREIFGDNSSEYVDFQKFKIFSYSPMFVMPTSEFERRARNLKTQQFFIENQAPKAKERIEQLIEWLLEKREDLNSTLPIVANEKFKGLNIHLRIYNAAKASFEVGHYSTAIFEASKALINLVKEKSGRSEDGEDLMNKVFSVDNPVLKFNNQQNQSEKDEQKGMMFLYKGMVAGIRNPKGHTEISQLPPIGPDKALEYLAFISLLAKRLDDTELCS